MNYCDFNHSTDEEVRLLPCGESNLIVCKKHWKQELEFREKLSDLFGTEEDFPRWESLKVSE